MPWEPRVGRHGARVPPSKTTVQEDGEPASHRTRASPARSESAAATPGIGPLLTLLLCTSGPFGAERAVRPTPPAGSSKEEMSLAVWLGAVRVSSRCNQAAIHSEDTVRRQCDFPRLGRPGCQYGGRAGVTSEVRHRVGRAGNDPPARSFFTELSLVTDFRCQNGRSWVRSASDAGPIYPAVVVHTGKSTKQRAQEARDDDADSEDDATGRQHALVQCQARQAVYLGE